MSRRREIASHLTTLGEIQGIMGGMKNLAFAEAGRLRRQLETQGRVVREVAAAAGEVLAFHPAPPPPPDLAPAWVVLGSERGFCGDFNEVLARALAEHAGGDAARVVAVGFRLHARLADDSPAVRLGGPGVADEVAGALRPLVDTLREMARREGPLAVSVLFHDPDRGEVRSRRLLPPFDPPPPRPASAHRSGFGPVLHLPPGEVVAALADHFVFAALHEVFLASLLAENQRRLQHLEGAIRRLDERRGELTRRANFLRQEEITEEIEMILLNVEARSGA